MRYGSALVAFVLGLGFGALLHIALRGVPEANSGVYSSFLLMAFTVVGYVIGRGIEALERIAAAVEVTTVTANVSQPPSDMGER